MQLLLGLRSVVLGGIEQARGSKYVVPHSNVKQHILLNVFGLQIIEKFAGSGGRYNFTARRSITGSGIAST